MHYYFLFSYLFIYLLFVCWQLTGSNILLHLWINSFNSNCISVLNDPWCFDIPINFKPTFINMDLIDVDIHISRLINESDWDYNAFI